MSLKEFEDSDAGFYLELCSSLDVGRRFRFGGVSISPPARASAIWDGVLCHLVAVGVDSRRRLGVVSLTSPDLRNGTAYLSAISDQDVLGSGLMVEAVALGLHYAFETWPWRKIYMEVPEYNLDAFRSGLDRFFVREGTLRQHVYLDATYWDVHVLAISRELWMARGVPSLERLGVAGRSGRAGQPAGSGAGSQIAAAPGSDTCG